MHRRGRDFEPVSAGSLTIEGRDYVSVEGSPASRIETSESVPSVRGSNGGAFWHTCSRSASAGGLDGPARSLPKEPISRERG